ncbi:NB-ARC domain-containing protein [Scytonema sp. NUACC26]|uniref:WD40 domain-containing protein n=1 Tax=Scytonema sp. NUACC26 TaxID=3140176 RepID=UPI0034DBCF1F
MTVEEAIALVEQLLERGRLTKVQEIVFRNSWDGKTYQEMAEELTYDPGHIKDVGSELWQLLSKALGEKVTKNNLHGVLQRNAARQQNSTIVSPTPNDPIVTSQTDWGEAIEVSHFYGRTTELETLHQWIVNYRCRIVALLGMGGMGKTALSVKLTEQLQKEFEYVVWRSLQNAPPVEEIVSDLIHFFSEQQEINLPHKLEPQVSRVLHYLCSSRCLIILDNLETILQDGISAGKYQQGYEGYGYLLKCVGEVNHQSCLILTSREKPKEVALLEGPTLKVRSLLLQGLTSLEGHKIFYTKGCFGVNEQELQEVCDHFAGNPLALKIAASAVQEVYRGDLGQLIPFLQQGKLQFEDINDLLQQQFNRLSPLEQQVMCWLAINREPVSLAELEADFVSETVVGQLLDAVQSLRRRAFVEQQEQQLALQPVLLEYVTHRIITGVCEEIANQRYPFLNDYALTKAQSKEYIRQAQIRLIVRPIINRLVEMLGSINAIEHQLKQMLALLQQEMPLKPGYAAGNILNILCEINADLSHLDCSHLAIWQAYLADATLHNVNFARSQFAKSVFKQTFGAVLCLAFSPDGEVLASSDAKGEINLWRVADEQCLLTMRGHTNWVRRIAFSPDGCSIASTSTDGTIRIWDVRDGRCLQIIQEYSCISYSVCFSPDGKLLASSSEDCKVRIWDVENRKCLQVMEGHAHWALSASFSPDGKLLASGSSDKTIRIWDVENGKCVRAIAGHEGWVVPVSFSPDGRQIASGSFDSTVRIWNVDDGKCLTILQGHTKWVWSVAWSPDGQQIASAGIDQTIRFWEVKSGKCLHAIPGHTSQIWSVAFHPDGTKVASGGEDQTIRFWDARNGKCLGFIGGHTNWVRSVAFSADGQTLISAHKDCSVRIWDVSSRNCLYTLNKHKDSVLTVAVAPNNQIFASGSTDKAVKIWNLLHRSCLHTLTGHTDSVWSVAFSPNGQLLASCSLDRTVRIWDVSNGNCLHILVGHSDRIGCVRFSPDGSKIASASEDQTVKLWNVNSGECLKTLQHQQRIWSVAFSPDGKSIASGCMNNTIQIWNAQSSERLQTLVGHTGWVLSVSFSHDSHQLISGSSDQTVKVWDVKSGRCLYNLQQHKNWVWSVVLSNNHHAIASASEDEAIHLWNRETGEWEATLQVQRPYEGTNITDVTGLTNAQEAALRALGAVEIS